jgi:hypothetical protein
LVKVASLRSVGQESLATRSATVTCGLSCQFEFKNLTFEKLDTQPQKWGIKVCCLNERSF